MKLLQQGQTVRAFHRPSSHRQRVLDAVQEACPSARPVDVVRRRGPPASPKMPWTGWTPCTTLPRVKPPGRRRGQDPHQCGWHGPLGERRSIATRRDWCTSSVAALGRKAGEPTTEDTLFEQPGTTHMPAASTAQKWRRGVRRRRAGWAAWWSSTRPWCWAPATSAAAGRVVPPHRQGFERHLTGSNG